MDKLRRYIQKLYDNRVKIGEDIFSDKIEDVDNKENVALFIDFLNMIYKDDNIAVFTSPFLENIDDFIIRPENIDLIKEMFGIINKNAHDFDIIMSGDFGLWVYDIIEKGIIKFKNNVVVVSGKIRNVKEDEGNKLEVLRKRFPDIFYKSFIFLDDSFVSGGTKDKIEQFLKKFNSRIYRTFAFYTHYKEDPTDVFSVYCYSDDIKDKIIPIHKHIDFINQVDLKEYADIIEDTIKYGGIKDIRDLGRTIKRIAEWEGVCSKKKVITKFKDFKYDNRI